MKVGDLVTHQHNADVIYEVMGIDTLKGEDVIKVRLCTYPYPNTSFWITTKGWSLRNSVS